MRKSRVISLAAVLLLASACGWIWWDRDRLAPRIINPWLAGDRIEALRGLQLGPGRLAFEQLSVHLRSGARLQLQGVQLLRPWSLVFAADENRSQLRIARLDYIPAETSGADSPAAVPSQGASSQEFTLSESTGLLRRYLPEKVQVEEMHWRGEGAPSDQLKLQRDHGSDTVDARLSTGSQQLSLQMQLTEALLRITARLDTAEQRGALALTAELAREDGGNWRGTAQLDSDLRQLAALPLPAKLGDIAASASGRLSATIRAQLPDRVLQFREYREISAELQGESVRFTLPETLLGVPIAASLSTTEPLAVKLAALQPPRPEELSGGGHFELVPVGQPPLLQARFETRADRGIPALALTGTVDLSAATPFLRSRDWQRGSAPLRPDSASGTVHFRGAAKLKPPGSRRDSGRDWLRDLSLTLLPESRASIALVAGDDKDSGPARFGWHKGAVDIQLPQALTLSAPRWPGEIRVTAGAMTLRAEEDRGSLSAEAQLRQVECRIAGGTHCSLQLSAGSPQLAQADGKLSLQGPAVSAQLELSLEGDRQRWQLRQTELRVEKLTRDTLVVERLSLQPPHLECTLTPMDPVCGSARLTAGFSTLEAPELRASGALVFDNVQFKTVDDHLSASADYRSDALNLQMQGRYKLDAKLEGQLSLVGGALRGETRAQAGPLQLRSQWQHNLDSARGGAHFTLPPVEFSRAAPLSESVQGLPVDIVAGTISASGHYSWPQAQGDRIELHWDKLAAVHGDSFATGAVGRLSLARRGEHWVTDKPRAMQLDTLDVGIQVKNIRVTAALDERGDLTLGSVSAELLGGTLRSPQLVWNLEGEERRSEVLLEGISLRELAGEMEAENFAASGILDLHIPLVTGADGITVTQGKVQSRPPGGRLRYYGAFSAEMLSGNPQLKLLAGALEDYNFRELSGTVEYPPSGDMQLQLKLVGRSKSVAVDRDLIINLNLENNIPSMLRSLQASRDLTEALEKQLQ